MDLLRHMKEHQTRLWLTRVKATTRRVSSGSRGISQRQQLIWWFIRLKYNVSAAEQGQQHLIMTWGRSAFWFRPAGLIMGTEYTTHCSSPHHGRSASKMRLFAHRQWSSWACADQKRFLNSAGCSVCKQSLFTKIWHFSHPKTSANMCPTQQVLSKQGKETYFQYYPHSERQHCLMTRVVSWDMGDADMIFWSSLLPEKHVWRC